MPNGVGTYLCKGYIYSINCLNQQSCKNLPLTYLYILTANKTSVFSYNIYAQCQSNNKTFSRASWRSNQVFATKQQFCNRERILIDKVSNSYRSISLSFLGIMPSLQLRQQNNQKKYNISNFFSSPSILSIVLR